MTAAATERGHRGADGPVVTTAVLPTILLVPPPPPLRCCTYRPQRRVAYCLALQGAVVIWALFFVDFSWLQPRKTTTQSRRRFWRIQPLAFSASSSSSGWISTNKTSVVVALSEDYLKAKQEGPKTVSSSSSSSINSKYNATSPRKVILPRVFLPWKNGTTSLAELCFPPEDKIMSVTVQRSPSPKGYGIFLNKLMKVGGSTAAGINLRIAMSIDQRYPNRTTTRGGSSSSRSISSSSSSNDSNTTIISGNTTAKRKFPLCRARWDHSSATRMQYGKRDLDHSFLWTVVREPTKRAVSQFFHFQVSKRNISATNHSAFRAYLSDVPLFYNYYLNTLRTNRPTTTPTTTSQQQLRQRHQQTLDANGNRRLVLKQQQRGQQKGERPLQTIQNILHDYDFIGITERMAESAVALMMLLNLTMPDVLYANAKTSGSYDALCNYIQPTNVTAEMQAFLDGPKWRKMVMWDSVLYQAANRSLDLTIEALNRRPTTTNLNGTVGGGAGAFDVNLQEFLRIQALVQAQCIQGKEVFPCLSTTGQKNPKPDCLWNDSGCGHSCIKRVVQQLGL